MSDPQLLQLEDSEPEAPERYDWPVRCPASPSAATAAYSTTSC